MPPARGKAVPEPKAQRNFTDPESRIMVDPLGWLFIPPNQRESSTAQGGGQGRPKNGAAASMRAKLTTDAGKTVYRMRKAIVEPIFGQFKEARGFRRFWLRGIDKVRSEWSLICLGHNLLKLFRGEAPGHDLSG